MILYPHRHRAVASARLNGVDHVGVYEVCRCKRIRMEGDRKWRPIPPMVRIVF